jgi:hypothetical protein
MDIFDDRNERVMRDRWQEIVDTKQKGEDIFEVNTKIDHVKTAIAVSKIVNKKVEQFTEQIAT